MVVSTLGDKIPPESRHGNLWCPHPQTAVSALLHTGTSHLGSSTHRPALWSLKYNTLLYLAHIGIFIHIQWGVHRNCETAKWITSLMQERTLEGKIFLLIHRATYGKVLFMKEKINRKILILFSDVSLLLYLYHQRLQHQLCLQEWRVGRLWLSCVPPPQMPRRSSPYTVHPPEIHQSLV